MTLVRYISECNMVDLCRLNVTRENNLGISMNVDEKSVYGLPPTCDVNIMMANDTKVRFILRK